MSRRPSLQWSEGAAGPVIDALADETAPARWEDYAACAEVGSDSWFPEKGGSSAQAKAICAECPVREPCLAFALAHMGRRDPLLNFGEWGIWGMTSRDERLEMRRGHPLVAAATTETGEKACTTCEVIKPLTAFWRNAKASDGRKSACITCLAAAQSRREAA